MKGNNNCYCLPTELFSKDYSKFSVKTKVLFAMVLTDADTGKSISELAELIETMGNRKIATLYNEVHKELAEHNVEGV